jgi:gas vesicle protein
MENKNNKTQTYLIGGLIGAAIGLIAAYLLDKTAGLEGENLNFTGKKASRTALGIVSLLWSLIEKS